LKVQKTNPVIVSDFTTTTTNNSVI